MNITTALILVHFLLFVYTFRFQRTTLGISRQALGQGSAQYQGVLTPSWMGILGWAQTGLYIIAIVMVFLTYGWLYAIGYVVGSQIGYSMFDAITPFPSYTYCFNVIKRHINSEMAKANDDEARQSLEMILASVVRSETEAAAG